MSYNNFFANSRRRRVDIYFSRGLERGGLINIAVHNEHMLMRFIFVTIPFSIDWDTKKKQILNQSTYTRLMFSEIKISNLEAFVTY